jgi:formate dehydrogenase iron-sulfur subunit
MAKPCIKWRFHFILAQQDRCAATLPIIWSPFPVSRMLRLWKARPLPAISSPVVCRAARLFLIGLSDMRRKLVSRQICILNNHHRALQAAEDSHVVTSERAKHESERNNGRARRPGAPIRWDARCGRPGGPSLPNAMIGEGIQSTNQRRHNYVQENVEVGFFTDPTVCIGCKACEVACKEWNEVPDDGFTWSGNSYDNTGHLGASTWRHVLFLEQDRRKGQQVVGSLGDSEDPFRWVFLSDVCKHCEEAGCLEACPTGSIVRTEVGSVFVQNDVCNGCGYCVVSCPFGVIDRRPQWLPDAGGAFKCTFCYDRQKSGLVPACAKVCPTESIVFGRLDDLRARGAQRVEQLKQSRYDDAQLYDPTETSVRGIHAFFLILGEPEAYGLPPKPQVPTIYLKSAWVSAISTAIAAFIAILCAFTFFS